MDSPLVTQLNYLCGKTSRLSENDIYGDTEKQKANRLMTLLSHIDNAEL